ncbi:MAG: hypothetical protein HC817_16365 [Saprospiraceae bacterium]|nr:hypothetical protein [Saprospiraceae bacterium]
MLEKIQAQQPLSQAEADEWKSVETRFDAICKKAYDLDVNLLVDGEETWIQDTIDAFAYKAMAKYNQHRAVIYNTYQLYRADMLQNLQEAFAQAQEKKYFLGAKLVRGAYMEKESLRAKNMGYPDPIQPTKDACDRDFNEALRFCMENLEKSACVRVRTTNSAISCLWS